jgi:nitroreductase
MFKKLMKANRSFRRFDESVRLSKKQITGLIDLTRFCPSAGNLQQLRYFYSIDKRTNQTIFPQLAWAAYLREWDGPLDGERPTAYIVMLGPKEISKYLLIDTGIAAQTILLGAVEMGFGGCQIASAKKDELHKALALPDHLEVILVLAIGKPVEQIVLEKVIDPEDIEYWRDEFAVHHVPKRALKDIIINK